ncbi:hypothetical protein RRG08_029827 [Elysia crispata]|uniref:Uncharacterized protein n=1 Tax=Elysia crispata TaxID=231223 RepID=A0AAE0YMH6_9GAST|nr:hypothetical protein RRG08_029827 [Elysia crispata]
MSFIQRFIPINMMRAKDHLKVTIEEINIKDRPVAEDKKKLHNVFHMWHPVPHDLDTTMEIAEVQDWPEWIDIKGLRPIPRQLWEDQQFSFTSQFKAHLAPGLGRSPTFIYKPVYGPSRASFGKINNSHLHPSLRPISHQVWEDQQFSFTCQFTAHLAPGLGRSRWRTVSGVKSIVDIQGVYRPKAKQEKTAMKRKPNIQEL